MNEKPVEINLGLFSTESDSCLKLQTKWTSEFSMFVVDNRGTAEEEKKKKKNSLARRTSSAVYCLLSERDTSLFQFVSVCESSCQSVC